MIKNSQDLEKNSKEPSCSSYGDLTALRLHSSIFRLFPDTRKIQIVIAYLQGLEL